MPRISQTLKAFSNSQLGLSIWNSIAAQPELAGGQTALLGARPSIRRLIAERRFSDGSVRYYMLVWDSGNFVVKSAPDKRLLDLKTVTKNVRVAGRFSNTMWVYTMDDGVIKIAELETAPKAELDPTAAQHRLLTLELAEGVAKIAKSILTFGVETPLLSPIKAIGDTFSYSSADGHWSGTGEIHFASAAVPKENFTAVRTNARRGHIEVLMSSGRLDSEHQVPKWFDLFSCSSSLKSPALLSRTEILEVRFGNVPSDQFLPQYYIHDGFHAVAIQTNTTLQFANLQSDEWRKGYAFGRTYSLRVAHYFVLGLLALLTLGAVLLTIRRTKPKKENN